MHILAQNVEHDILKYYVSEGELAKVLGLFMINLFEDETDSLRLNDVIYYLDLLQKSYLTL